MESESPKELHYRRERERQLIEEHHEKFRDPDGTVNRKMSEYRDCPVCESSDERELFHKNGGRYVACEGCGMIYLNPCLTSTALSDYYSFNTTIQAESHRIERDFYEAIYKSGLELLSGSVTGGSVLDVGCSGGLFLDVAKAAGWETFGTELNVSEAALAKASGHRIWCSSAEYVQFGRTFDAITLWDVFEHLRDGRAFLDFARALLSPGGALFMQIPNGGALAARMLQEKCNMFDGLEHLSLFDPYTITMMAASARWEVVEMRSVIDEIRPMLNHLNYEHPYRGSFEFFATFDFLDSERLLSKMLGYKLQIVLRPL